MEKNDKAFRSALTFEKNQPTALDDLGWTSWLAGDGESGLAHVELTFPKPDDFRQSVFLRRRILQSIEFAQGGFNVLNLAKSESIGGLI